MSIIVVSIHIAAAVILVLTVLLQAGKGAGMGAAFGGGASGTVFGTRGPATFISKITCIAAVVFMCTSLNLALSQGGMKRGSVMDEWSAAEVGATAATATVPVIEDIATEEATGATADESVATEESAAVEVDKAEDAVAASDEDGSKDDEATSAAE